MAEDDATKAPEATEGPNPGPSSPPDAQKLQTDLEAARAEIDAWKQWAGPLATYRDKGVTGTAIGNHLAPYLQAEQDPRRKAALERILANESRRDASGDEEEFLTDEERKIQHLETELGQLKTQLGQQHAAQGQTALAGHLAAVSKEWGLSEEARSELARVMGEQVKTWSTQGEVGRAAIDRLLSPTDGASVVAMTMVQKLGPKGIRDLFRDQLSRDPELRARMRTDGPSKRLAAGADPPETFKSTAEMLEFIEQNPEILDREGYSS